MIFKGKNYQVWDIKEQDFPKKGSIEEKIRFLLGYAVLAPSTFNSQPWKCRIKDNKVEIYLDLTRMPKQSDKKGRFGHISIGCFIENLLVTADYFGVKYKLYFRSRTLGDLKQVAKVEFLGKGRPKLKKELFFAIPKRITNRSLGLKKKISMTVLEGIKTFASQSQKVIVLDRKFSAKLIKLSEASDLRIWSDEEFRKENSRWVRHNLTSESDGMPGFGVGISLIPSFLGKFIILSKAFPKMQAKRNIESLAYSNFYIVLCSKSSNERWVEIGMLFEKIALYLTNFGIATIPMGQFIEDNGTMDELKKMIRIDAELHPQLFFRICYPSQSILHSPRFAVGQILL